MRHSLRFLLLAIALYAGGMLFAKGGSGLSRDMYIEKYHELAIKEMNRVGIPASITLAQGMLESGNGNSTLAQKSNNHFGIKCHNDWKGKRVYHDDDKKGECFRKYKNPYQSYIDHSDFLTGKQRYASLFDLKLTDYKGWAKGLKKAGYATDPKYAHRLIDIIEANNLDRFDKGGKYKKSSSKSKSNSVAKNSGNDNFTINAFGAHKIQHNNGVKYVKVQEGDSFDNISREYGLKSWELFSYNDMEENADISEFKYVYVQPKRNKAHRKHSSHRIKTGESLHYVSQKYGVKINRLYRYNNLKEGDKVKEGQAIQLRKKKK
ncbi:glucosaminidase domain-containing protein [Labilibacter marinus]|uniref:glucosaminidase domain-containing protein n=1 Tax=Labilibacter marinus TaxID=1477105 RepID=UPI00094FC099|nr:glucosaminidase domain-containing protein [Labilibacter marinus]